MQPTASATSVTPVTSANTQSAHQPPSSTTSNKPPTVSTRPSHDLDPAAPDYHDKLLKGKFISSEQLKAVRSGNKDDIKKANENANAIAVTASIKSFNKEQAVLRESMTPSGQRARDQLLKENYRNKGYQFIFNSAKGHNCLIISMLQHLTGDYTSNHDEKAGKYRAKLNKYLASIPDNKDKKILHNDLLHSDHLPWLLKAMEKDHSLSVKDASFIMWTSDSKGEPFWHSLSEGKKEYILFQGQDHIEAVVSPKVGDVTKTQAKPTATKPELKSETAKLSGTVIKSNFSQTTEADTKTTPAPDGASGIESDEEDNSSEQSED